MQLCPAQACRASAAGPLTSQGLTLTVMWCIRSRSHSPSNPFLAHLPRQFRLRLQ